MLAVIPDSDDPGLARFDLAIPAERFHAAAGGADTGYFENAGALVGELKVAIHFGVLVQLSKIVYRRGKADGWRGRRAGHGRNRYRGGGGQRGFECRSGL